MTLENFVIVLINPGNTWLNQKSIMKCLHMKFFKPCVAHGNVKYPDFKLIYLLLAGLTSWMFRVCTCPSPPRSNSGQCSRPHAEVDW